MVFWQRPIYFVRSRKCLYSACLHKLGFKGDFKDCGKSQVIQQKKLMEHYGKD